MAASDISSWIGVDRHRAMEEAKASRRFDDKVEILLFEAIDQGRSKYCKCHDMSW